MADMIRSKLLSEMSAIEHGFSVGACEIEEMVRPGMRVFRTDQVHGSRVVRLEGVEGDDVIEADAFVTNAPGLVCHVRTADCVPILIADGKRRAVAAVHAGWRGIALDVAGAAIEEMGRAYGTEPADCCAAIGPCICGPCYEVGPEVIDAVRSLGVGEDWLVDDRHVDLSKANASLLERAGVRRIESVGLCTSCDIRFVSWRCDRAGARQASFITVL
jgi:YfiH family protein